VERAKERKASGEKHTYQVKDTQKKNNTMVHADNNKNSLKVTHEDHKDATSPLIKIPDGYAIFNDSFKVMKEIYATYYPKITDVQKKSLNISSEVDKYLIGANPKFICEFLDGELETLAVISYNTTQSISNKIILSHFSTLNVEKYVAKLEQCCNYINKNIIFDENLFFKNL
jgi:hypothetical protein